MICSFVELDRQGDQREVDPVRNDAFDAFARRQVDEAQVDARMLQAQPAQDRRQRVGHRRVGGADLNAADPTVAKAAHRRFGEIAILEYALRGLDQVPARDGGMRLLAHALEQPYAEAPLELADLQAHRRLREVEPARRGREAAELDDLEQGPQLVEIEASHLKDPLIKPIETTNLPYPWRRCNLK